MSRSLAACEGALLVVDASQGVEAQTVANCYTATEQGVEVVPVLNKMDLPQAEPERVIAEIEDIIGIPAQDALRVSAKTGEGVRDILEAVIARIPPPRGRPGGAAEGAHHRFVVRQLRRRGDAGARGGRRSCSRRTGILFMSTGATYLCEQVGRIHAQVAGEGRALRPGEVGFVIAGIKELKAARVGDTLTLADAPGRPSRCPASRRSSRRCSPASTRSTRTSTTRCATRWRSCT